MRISHGLRSLSLCLIVLSMALAIVSSAANSQTGPDEDQVRTVVKILETDAAINNSHSICPAQYFGEAEGWLYGWGWRKPPARAACRNDLPNCLQACQGGSGRACWVLATIMATSEIKGADEAGDKLHAHACHAGYPSGCTNRGGGIRDFLIKETDPLAQWSIGKRAECSFKMFQRGCKGGKGGWGCVMLGDAYRTGLGTKVIPRLAIESYEGAKSVLCSSVRADGEGNAMDNIRQGCRRATTGIELARGLRHSIAQDEQHNQQNQ